MGFLGHETSSDKCDKLVALGGKKEQQAKFNNKKLNQKAMSWLFWRVDSETQIAGC